MNEIKHNQKSLADWVALEIGSLGENIAIRRGVCMRSDEGGHIGHYVHAASE